MQYKAEELGNLKTTVSLDPEAKIKGKVAAVLKRNDNEKERYETAGFNAYYSDFAEEAELAPYALSKERMALKPEEIETLINITCKKDKFIGQYKSTTDNQAVPAYAIKCSVSIIDYPTKTIVAQKDFENNKPLGEAKVSSATDRLLNPIPWEEIEKYLRSFPGS